MVQPTSENKGSEKERIQKEGSAHKKSRSAVHVARHGKTKKLFRSEENSLMGAESGKGGEKRGAHLRGS